MIASSRCFYYYCRTTFLHSHPGCGVLADGATLRHLGSTPSRDDNPDEAYGQQTRRFPPAVWRGMCSRLGSSRAHVKWYIHPSYFQVRNGLLCLAEVLSSVVKDMQVSKVRVACILLYLTGTGSSHAGPSPRYTPYEAAYNYHHREYIMRRSITKKGKGVRPSPQGRPFSRTIIAVDELDKKLPRGERRTTLHNAGCFVDFYPSWREQEVRETIQLAFNGAVDSGYVT